MRTTLLALAAGTMAAAAVPAAADPWKDESGNGRRYQQDSRYYSNSGARTWRGDDGRYYCGRPDGTTGLVVGAAAGALAGRAIDTRGDRMTGTILGAAAGALLGRHVERNVISCR
jgi:hypothetical protein